MKRRIARTDANHSQVVAALRKAGCKVLSLAAIGNGCPDLLVLTRPWTPRSNFLASSRLVLIEVKDGDKPPSRRRLTDAEADFHAEWSMAPIYTVESPVEAIRAVCGDV